MESQKEKRERTGKIFETRPQKIPNLTTDRKSQVQEIQRIPRRINVKNKNLSSGYKWWETFMGEGGVHCNTETEF